MKTKWGALMTDGRGKIGGQVASKNRAGSYLRTKVTPVNPRTPNQTNVRARLANNSIAWRGLTEAQRQSWNQSVKSFQSTDIFGDLKSPSGFNLYQKLNNNLGIIGVAPITICPNPAAVASVSPSSLSATVAGQVLSLALSAAVPAGVKMVVRATTGMSQGVSFVASQLRILTVINAAATTPVLLTALYANKFGSFVAGQKIFVSVQFINIATGQANAPQIVSAIAA